MTRPLTSLLASLLSLAALAGLPAAAAAERGANASVISGTAASIAELPSLAYVQVPGSACTGTVVAPRVVLTAAHCVMDVEGTERIFPVSGFAVTTGVADLRTRQPENVSTVTQALVFPGYDARENRGDAALLILAAPVAAPALSLVQPGEESLSAPGAAVQVAGWGLTGPPPNGNPSPVLRQGQAVVQDAGYCRRTVLRYSPTYLPDWQLCIVDRPGFEVSGCSGDSGGPLIARAADGRPVQVGVVSFGRFDCNPRQPGVMTRVDRVAAWAGSWIQAVENGAPAPAVFTPKVRPLQLSIPDGKRLIAQGLAEELGRLFTAQSAGRFRGCQRVAAERVKCGVEWLQGSWFYAGTTTAYLTTRFGPTLPLLRYKIERVKRACFFSDRPSCPVQVKRG